MDRKEEKQFKQLMSHSRLEMPDEDFEDQLMSKIESEAIINSMPFGIKVGWALILVVLVLGVISSSLLTKVEIELFNIQSGNFKLLFELVLAVFLLLQIDTLIQFTKNSKSSSSTLGMISTDRN